MKDLKTQKELGQFFTPRSVAELVTRFTDNAADTVIDLAAGAGDLLESARARYPAIDISALDIDTERVCELEQLFPFGKVAQADTLDLSLQMQNWVESDKYDFVVGNPPYNRQPISPWTARIVLEELGLDCSKQSSIRAEIAFLALSLRTAKPGGVVSLILPNTIASGESWKWLRRVLLQNHRVLAVASLPSRVFQNTEVETCTITLEKRQSANSKIKVVSCDVDGVSIGELSISIEDAVHRLDYGYHKWRMLNRLNNSETFGQAGVQIVRGNIHSKEARSLGINIFHTTSFNSISAGVVYFSTRAPKSAMNLVSVVKNDILIPRIGRNLNHLAIVGSGESVISDCIFGLRAPAGRAREVQRALESDSAKEWIKVHTTGACAKLISKKSILNMPLFN